MAKNPPNGGIPANEKNIKHVIKLNIGLDRMMPTESTKDIQLFFTGPKWIKYDQIYIEVKASSYANGFFFLTRNEWNFALSVKDDFFIHLWIQNKKRPRIISYKELLSKEYRTEDASNSEWIKTKKTPVKIN